MGILGQRRLGCLDHALGLDLGLLQGTGCGIFLGMLHGILQHAGNLVIGKTVRWLDRNAGFDTGGLLAGRNRQQAIGIDLESDANACRAGHHGGNAAQFEAGQRAAIGHHFTLALHDMDGHRRLAVLEGREFLRPCGRDGRVARDDLFDQAAHCFQAKRQGNDIEQQPVVLASLVASQQIGLRRRAQRNHLVRVEVGQRLLAEEIANCLLHLWHARRTADHHDALDVFRPQASIAQGLLDGLQRLGNEGLRNAGKGRHIQLDVDHFAIGQTQRNRRFGIVGEEFLGFATAHHQATRILQRQRLRSGLLDHPAIDAVVEIVSPQRRIAAGGHHLEHSLGQLQDGNIERSSPQVIHRINAFRGIIQAVGDGSSRRLVEQAENIQAGQAGGILGCLALRIIEVGRHGNDCTDQIATQRRLGTRLERFQDFGRGFDRTLDAGMGLQLDHAGRFDEVVRHRFDVSDVLGAPPHEALDGHDGVLWIDCLVLLRVVTDFSTAIGVVAHHRRQQRAALLVVQADGQAAADGGDQGIGRTEVDADGELVLVRCRRFTRLGDLKQSHFLFFQRRQRVIDFVQKFFQEHQTTHTIRRQGKLCLVIEQLPEFLVARRDVVAQAVVQALQFMVIAAVARFHDGLAPLHLFHQEIGRHRGVALGLDVMTGQMEQVLGPLQRLFQGLVGLVGVGGPLHRQAALRFPGMGEAVRMNLRLNVAITRIQIRQVQPERRLDAEEDEMVSLEIHQTLNDSPQPH